MSFKRIKIKPYNKKYKLTISKEIDEKTNHREYVIPKEVAELIKKLGRINHKNKWDNVAIFPTYF